MLCLHPADRGELGGARILGRKTIELMTLNHLPGGQDISQLNIGGQFSQVAYEGVGFGLGFSVRVKMSPWDPQGHVGEYGWGGAASTHYWVSPKDELIVVTMEQVMPYSFTTEWAVKKLIYDAIEN